MSERVEYLDDNGRYLPRMYDELVGELAAKYDMKEWLRRCRAKELHPDLQVQFEEEAARLEFDMDVPREAAEQRAAEIVFNKFNIL